MTKVYRVSFKITLKNFDKTKLKQIQSEFNTVKYNKENGDLITIICEIQKSEFEYVPNKWEVYRLVRNQSEDKFNLIGVNVTYKKFNIEQIDNNTDNKNSADIGPIFGAEQVSKGRRR